jgi:two-component system, LuxR family, sensor kinase FixL
MGNGLRILFSAPIFEDEETTRIAGLLNPILLTMLGFTTFYALWATVGYANPLPILKGVLLLLALWAIAFVLMRVGKVRLGGQLFLWGVWGTVTYIAILSGGVKAQATTTYIPITLAAGLLLGWRTGVIFFGLSALTETGLFLAEVSFNLSTLSVSETLTNKVLGLLTNLILTVLLSRLTTIRILQALTQAHRNAGQLQETNQQLRQVTTQLTQREHALRESEQRYRIVTELMTDYLFKLAVAPDGSATMAWISENFPAVTGRAADDVQTPDSWGKIIHPEDLPALMRALHDTVETNQPVEIECRSFLSTGALRWVHVVARAEWDEVHQHPVAIIGAVRDITDRKQFENSLRQAQKDWEEIFQAIGHPTLILDPQYTILAANRAAVQVAGKSAADLKTQKCFELFHLSTGSPGRCPMQKLLDSNQMETVEMEMEAFKGTFLVACTPVRDDQGHLEKIIHIATDITARKQAEEQVNQLNAELEQRVHQRTAELEAANRELKDFAYSVSHDLKAPLRAISRLAQWLVDDYAAAFDARGKEMVGMLIGRVKRMDDLIEGILEYSRIGRVHGEHTRIDVNRLVYEVIDSLVPPPHIQITVARSLPTIRADKTRMIQVFQNLIGNAIKFLDKPYGLIRVDCADERTFWRFSVTDNGPGIDAKYHVQIFQMFQTLHARDDVESTGIGLALVKKIVELYGGEVGIRSTPGEGSTFFFTLPKEQDQKRT